MFLVEYQKGDEQKQGVIQCRAAIRTLGELGPLMQSEIDDQFDNTVDQVEQEHQSVVVRVTWIGEYMDGRCSTLVGDQ